jgi:phosphohistidine phosphatase
MSVDCGHGFFKEFVMKLYCVRHCEAHRAIDDPSRGLTELGLSDAEKLANHIKQKEIIIPYVMHSGIKRAEETALIMSEACQFEKVTADPDLLADQADISLIVDQIKQWNQDTMLVGHMPYMLNLVMSLLTDNDDESNKNNLLTYSPGTMVCLARVASGRWVIDWITKPDNL